MQCPPVAARILHRQSRTESHPRMLPMPALGHTNSLTVAKKLQVVVSIFITLFLKICANCFGVFPQL